ncbi:hypothetical protein Tco_0970221 [Tanacetum coccineum]
MELNLSTRLCMIIMKALESFTKRQCQGLHSRTALSKDGTELLSSAASDTALIFSKEPIFLLCGAEAVPTAFTPKTDPFQPVELGTGPTVQGLPNPAPCFAHRRFNTFAAADHEPFVNVFRCQIQHLKLHHLGKS